MIRPSTPPPDPPFPVLRVVPLPISFTTGSKVTVFSPDCTFTLQGRLANDAPDDLVRAIERTKAHILKTRMGYLSPERGAEYFAGIEDKGVTYLQEVHLELNDTGHAARGETIRSIKSCAQAAAEERPDLEAYTLSIPLDGPARITASSALGLLRGLTTFEQLFYYHPDDKDQGKLYAPFAPYEIKDKSEFGWRGLMLDTSRNWFSLDAILKVFDTMSLAKLNVFHWHITDSNSWPLDLKKFPGLADKGAYSSQQRYSEEDLQHAIDYAGERGIDVVLEFDTPGHAAIIANSYPEHIAGANARPVDVYALQPPAGELCFATDGTVQWTKEVFAEFVRLGGGGKYMGSGGDELNEQCMKDDAVTQASLKKKGLTLEEALELFIGEIHKPIHAAGKTPVVWQEMARSHGPMSTLSRDAVVHMWSSSTENATEVLQKGFKIVHVPSNYFYLDAGQGGWIAQPHGSDSWCGQYKTWARMLSFDPYACLKGMDETEKAKAKKRILGGQACLWAEQTDENNLEVVLWPRLAALGELYWTGDKSVGGGTYPRDTIEALPRMHDIRYRMVDRGVRAVPLQPHWCALRPELSWDGA